MYIVLDSNIIPPLFNSAISNHNDYIPVLESLRKKKCIMLMGGTKYNSEVRKLSSYLRIINEMDKTGSVKKINDSSVDTEMGEVTKRARIKGCKKNPGFDDPHIIALIIVGRGKVIVTSEKKGCRFFKDRDLYGSYSPIPKIYKRREHCTLLRA